MSLNMPEFSVYSLWMILVPYMAIAWIIMAVGDRLRGNKIENEDHLKPERMIVAMIPWLVLIAVSVVTPIEIGPLFWTGLGLSIVSLIIYVSAISAFVAARRGVTTIGVYRASRNPMYVALFILLVGFVLMAWQAATVTGVITLAITLWISATTHWGVLTEERYLESKFGDEYLSYKRGAPRYVGGRSLLRLLPSRWRKGGKNTMAVRIKGVRHFPESSWSGAGDWKGYTMELDEKEFRAMNNPIRRFAQRMVEYPVFRLFGLGEGKKDILEIGCGSGYGARLLAGVSPNSYVGVDVMSEQIALAERFGPKGCEFLVMDITDLSHFPDESKDVIVDFAILHHVEDWERALRECRRVLRRGGRIFLEEPSPAFLRVWDSLFHWNHPKENRFEFAVFEAKLEELGFVIERRMRLFVFGFYSARKV